MSGKVITAGATVMTAVVVAATVNRAIKMSPEARRLGASTVLGSMGVFEANEKK